MDRLSDAARGALGSYRDTLALETRRVERNWSAIERRAVNEAPDEARTQGDARDDAVVVAVPRTRNTVAILAAAVAVAAAIVAVLAVGPGLAAEHGSNVRGAAAYEVRDRDVAQSEPSITSRKGAPTPQPDADPPVASTPILEATPIVDAPAPPPSTRTRSPKRSASSPAPALPTVAVDRDPAAELLAETALLRRARAALRDGDARGALAATDEYARRFASGTIAEEIAFVRLSALCKAGRVDEGRAAARGFAERYPGSPLSARAAKSCDEPS